MIFIIKPCIITINLFHFYFHSMTAWVNQNDDWCPFASKSWLESRWLLRHWNFFLLLIRFLDTEIAPAIKPTPQNKGQNVDTKYQLNSEEMQCFYHILICFAYTTNKSCIQYYWLYQSEHLCPCVSDSTFILIWHIIV